MTEKEKIEVETVECVQLEGIDAQSPADPVFRVEIYGVCFDFEHKQAADRLAGILNRMREDNERLTEELDEAQNAARLELEHARQIAQEARKGHAALEEEESFWEACGYPRNRDVLTISEQASSIIRERDEAIARAERAEASLPEDIREKGWAVAVHNDYRLNGEKHTFWLFTKGDFAIKGEGLTDVEALDAIRTNPSFFTLTDGVRK